MAERQINPLLKTALEFGPLAVFFIAYQMFRGEQVQMFGQVYEGIVMATIVFIPVILVTLAISWRLSGEIPRMAAVTAVVVIVFGGLTIWLNDPTFIKMKPTIVNLLFAAVLGWGLMMGQSYLKLLMGQMMPLTDAGWMTFTGRFALFFLAMAVMNEVVWRSFDEATWVAFKTFAPIPINLAFIASQMPFLKRNWVEDSGA